MNARKVLLVGGIADGQWTAVDDAVLSGQRLGVIEVPGLPVAASEGGWTAVKHQYRVQEVELFGWKLWVGLHDELRGIERSRATLKAVLQRDVAQQMGVLR